MCPKRDTVRLMQLNPVGLALGTGGTTPLLPAAGSPVQTGADSTRAGYTPHPCHASSHKHWGRARMRHDPIEKAVTVMDIANQNQYKVILAVRPN